MYRFIILVLPLLYSFNFGPMTQTISISEGQKSTQFQVDNTSNQTIPVVLKAVARQQKPDGTEDLPETKLVTVFPPQLVIPAGEKRTVRVDWKGDTNLKKEASFRIIAEQVPLSLDEKTKKKSGGIKMLLRYMSALYITPKDAKPNISVESFELSKKLNVTLSNTGNMHQYLKNIELSFTHKDKKIQIPSQDLAGLEGQNILANSKRVFIINRPEGLTKQFKGLIKFAP